MTFEGLLTEGMSMKCTFSTCPPLPYGELGEFEELLYARFLRLLRGWVCTFTIGLRETYNGKSMVNSLCAFFYLAIFYSDAYECVSF